MNTRIQIRTLRFLLLALTSAFSLQPSALVSAAPLGTAFTYQGRLTETGTPVNGLYDFRLGVFDDEALGNLVGLRVDLIAMPVSNGLFTVQFDPGEGVFDGARRWLQISVRTNGGSYRTLTPRQPITAAPQALYAPNAGQAAGAGVANAVIAGGVNGTALAANSVDGGKILDSSVSEADLSGAVRSNTFWRLGGNSGTLPGPSFLGTADNQPLELKVNGQRALRLEPNATSPNTVGGHSANAVSNSVYGATIGGGGSATQPNQVGHLFGTVGGGAGNTNSAFSGVIAGGSANTIGFFSSRSVIGGGEGNTIGPEAVQATIGGGFGNVIQTNASSATIAGGQNNRILSSGPGYGAQHAFIGGGADNSIDFSALAAGILGGYGNQIGYQSTQASIGGGAYNQIEPNAAWSVIGGGQQNFVSLYSYHATIPGGFSNRVVNGSYSLAAGRRASALHPGTFVWADSTNAEFASTRSNQFLIRATSGVGIGTNNPQAALHVAGTVLATQFAGDGSDLTNLNVNAWRLGGNAGTTPGQSFLGTTDYQPLEFKVGGERALRLEPNATSPNVIGGHAGNVVGEGIYGATICGGGGPWWSLPNRVEANYATVVGGQANVASGENSTAMGDRTTASGLGSTAMGYTTVASGILSTAMGDRTTASGSGSTAMGMVTMASGSGSTAMGMETLASGWDSTAMGYLSVASGNSSMAAGTRARALHPGAFVWADSQNADFSSTANNQFLIRASGGVGLGTNNPQAALHVAGTVRATQFAGDGSNLTNLNAWHLGGNAGTTPGQSFLGTTDNQPLEFKVNGKRALRLEPNGSDSPNVIGGWKDNVVSEGIYGATIGGGGGDGPWWGWPNRVEANYATVVGGKANVASGENSTAMGFGITASGYNSTAMGYECTASGYISTAMGDGTIASGDFSTAMGYGTTASGGASIAMGSVTEASGFASIAMGYDCTASGWYSTAMGSLSAASGAYTMAAGRRAKALHQGVFVWADSQDADFSSSANNQFLIRAAGSVVVQADDTDVDSEANQLLIRGHTSNAQQLEIGYKTSGNYATIQAIEQSVAFRPLILQPAGGRVGIGKTDPATALDVDGTVTATAFNPPSDRNLKERFVPVNPVEVLDKVAALPISRWNFKADAATPHVGPMAQDFHAAFGLGTDDKHIATVDADGVALAAIQGLNQKLESENQSIHSALEAKDAKITELEKRLATLEQIVRNQSK